MAILPGDQGMFSSSLKEKTQSSTGKSPGNNCILKAKWF
jgi:hypothetical protein